MSCCVLPQLWECQCRARAGSPAWCSHPSLAAQGAASLPEAQGTCRAHPGVTDISCLFPRTCFSFSAIQEEPWPLPPAPQSLELLFLCVTLICPCTEDLCSGTKTFELCAKSVALPDLAAQRTRPQKHQFRISLRMALQTPCLGHDCGSGGRAGGIFS